MKRTGPLTKEFLMQYRTITPNGCWEWTRAKRNKWGYGQTYESGRHVLVHRVAYRLWVGEIPKGMLVCHRCDNPPCFNPAHLFSGTNDSNSKDCVAKGRRPRLSGDLNWNSKLNSSQADEIRKRYASPGWRKHGLTVIRKIMAEEFGVSDATIQRVVYGKAWQP